MHTPKRITVFLGYYGSGKTELAVNYAFWLKEQGKDVVLVDFDIVNPYFRSKDAEELLQSKGIRLIAPAFANSNLENPSLPPEIYSVFTNKDVYVIFDVGGGDDGATPLGRYAKFFAEEEIDVFFVVNARRLPTATAEDIKEAYCDIASVCRISVSALINNTNLKEETTAEMILEGQKIIETVSEDLRLPIAYIAGVPAALEDIPEQVEAERFPIYNYIHLLF